MGHIAAGKEDLYRLLAMDMECLPSTNPMAVDEGLRNHSVAQMTPNEPSTALSPANSIPPVVPSSASASEIILSDEQKAILSLVKAGRSIFFTGSAGNI